MEMATLRLALAEEVAVVLVQWVVTLQLIIPQEATVELAFRQT